MSRKRRIGVLGALIIQGSILSAQVPAPYQETYNYLSSQIAAFTAALKSSPSSSFSPALSAPQALRASSDLYTNLVQPDYYDEAVTPQLNSFQALGAKAVVVHINFPILYQPYYRSISNPALYQQFVNFYQQFAQDVHARGMKLVVESVVGVPLPGTFVQTFQTYFKSLSWTAYMNGRALNALNVAQLIQPDYMTVITEPDTEASTSGQAEVGTLTGATQLLQTILNTLHQAGIGNVLVGAGAGTWITSYSSWAAGFLAQPLDFLDMHVIACSGSALINAITGAQMAHAAGKKVGVSEAWILKYENPNNAPGSAPADLDYLNAFSFWAPIDTSFLQSMAAFAGIDQVAFVGPSWTTYFSAYLDYNTYGSLPPETVLDDAYSAAATAMNAGQFTSTALAWENATIPAPDTTAPATPGAPTAPTVGTTTVVLNWTPTSDNVGVAGYDVYRNRTLIATVNGTSYRDNGVSPGVSYNYVLAAFDASGNVSPKSALLPVTTINDVPPSVPSHLRATAVSANSLSLAWSASTGGAVSYRVLKGTSPTSLDYHAIVSGTTYTDTHISANTTYYYEVESTNADGYSSNPSNELTVTTPSQ